jgi:hypothetical protein
MTTFKLEYNGETKTFAEWGITNVVLTQQSQGVDTVTFTMPSKRFDDDYVFPYRGTIILLRDDGAGNVRFFYGVVTKRSGEGSSSESHSYIVSNPSWHLSRIPFQQDWKFLKTGAEFPLEEDDYQTIQIGHLLLNVTNAGAKTGIKAQLASILDVAIARGVPMAYDASQFPDVDAPIDEIRDTTCSGCIDRELSWSPDCAVWWDYTTTPYPTMHIARRSSLTEKTLNATNGERVVSINIDPREDLLLDGVILRYQTTTRVNNSVLNTTTILKAPNEDVAPGVAVLDATINLEGSTTAYAEGFLTVQAVNPTSAAWWKEKIPVLNKSNIQNLTVVANSVSRQSSLANEIIVGEYASWMGGSCETDTIEVSLSYTLMDDSTPPNVIKEVTGQRYNHRCHVTNLASNIYRSLSEYTPGEAIPTNLHTYLYEAASVLHYDGTIVLGDDECPGDINVGNVVNITGSRSEWETMRALVQEVSMDLDNRTTTIRIGPPAKLGHNDIIELLRASRTRMRFTPITARSNAQGGTSGAIQMPERGTRENTQQAPPAVDRYLIGDASLSRGGHIDLNMSLTNGKALIPREMSVCVKSDDGTWREGFVMALCSEVYYRE